MSREKREVKVIKIWLESVNWINLENLEVDGE